MPDLTRDEAAQALRQIDESCEAMRRVVRQHRGHLHLWLWGSIWTAVALSVHFFGERATRWIPWFILPGIAASIAIGIYQARQIKTPFDQRFLRALACLIVFGLLSPVVTGASMAPVNHARAFAFFALLAMQVYVLAGIWFDNYLLVIGVAVSALILIGLFVFPQTFWLWFAIFCGGPVLLSGFVVRFAWR